MGELASCRDVDVSDEEVVVELTHRDLTRVEAAVEPARSGRRCGWNSVSGPSSQVTGRCDVGPSAPKGGRVISPHRWCGGCVVADLDPVNEDFLDLGAVPVRGCWCILEEDELAF